MQNVSAKTIQPSNDQEMIQESSGEKPNNQNKEKEMNKVVKEKSPEETDTETCQTKPSIVSLVSKPLKALQELVTSMHCNFISNSLNFAKVKK